MELRDSTDETMLPLLAAEDELPPISLYAPTAGVAAEENVALCDMSLKVMNWLLLKTPGAVGAYWSLETGGRPMWKSMAVDVGTPSRNLRLLPISGIPEKESNGRKDDAGDLDLLFLRQPPPTGTFRSAPPLVQYLRQVLQKCRGWDRL